VICTEIQIDSPSRIKYLSSRAARVFSVAVAVAVATVGGRRWKPFVPDFEKVAILHGMVYNAFWAFAILETPFWFANSWRV
jgi:hypothetical protein